MGEDVIKILLIEDDEDDYIVVAALLRKITHFRCELNWAATYEAGLQEMTRHVYDICLLDYRLDGRTGLELMKESRGRDAAMPVIFLTGLGDDDLDVRALRAGAADYLMKSRLDAYLLERAIRYALERRRVEQEREELAARSQQVQKFEALTVLAGGLVHDFRNLLMSIRMNATLGLKDAEGGGCNVERLKDIDQLVREGSDLVGRLLNFVEGGRPEAVPVDLNALVRRSSEAFGRTHQHIRIDTEFDQDIPMVEGDPKQIQQVLLNLYLNAADAMDQEGILSVATGSVSVSLTHPLVRPIDPGEYVVVSVADNGAGMDETTQDRVFEPFFTTKKAGQGTGLGLSSVYGIMKGHGGFVHVSSRVNIGTTFHLYFPIRKNRTLQDASFR